MQYKKSKPDSTLALLGLTMTLSILAVGAGDDSTSAIPAEAIPAMKKYDAAAAAADAVRAKAIDRAKAVLVSDLKGAQRAALAKNDVDGATAIAELAKNYQGTPAFDGVWHCNFPGYLQGHGPVSRIYVIKVDRAWVEDATVKGTASVPFRVIDGMGYADFPPSDTSRNEREVVRFQIIGDRLLLDMFTKPSDYTVGKDPDEVGEAVRRADHTLP